MSELESEHKTERSDRTLAQSAPEVDKEQNETIDDLLIDYEIDVVSLQEKEKSGVLTTDEFRNRLKERQKQFTLALTKWHEREILFARINELTELDNAYDEVTPENFHEYYLKRLEALREQNNG